MALEIIESCTSCWACEPLCPSKAIYEAKPHFMIDPDKCNECSGDFEDSQCASICPIEGAILNEDGVPMNPPGSLTGIPLQNWRPEASRIMATVVFYEKPGLRQQHQTKGVVGRIGPYRIGEESANRKMECDSLAPVSSAHCRWHSGSTPAHRVSNQAKWILPHWMHKRHST